MIIFKQRTNQLKSTYLPKSTLRFSIRLCSFIAVGHCTGRKANPAAFCTYHRAECWLMLQCCSAAIKLRA